jgi:hypothetical protein
METVEKMDLTGDGNGEERDGVEGYYCQYFLALNYKNQWISQCCGLTKRGAAQSTLLAASV